MNARRIGYFVIVAAIAAIGLVYAFTHKTAVAPTIDNQLQKVEQIASPIQYQGIEGKTALEILKSSHDVKTQEFSGIGEFVTTIDGVEADGKTKFWAFYVNGQQAQVGAGSYVTKSSDMIDWKLEEIK